jgi:hypothetical protein
MNAAEEALNMSDLSGTDIPRGIEVLVKKAAVDPEFRDRLMSTRSAAAAGIGLDLEDTETAMIDAIPAALLESIIDHTTVPDAQRRAFLGRAAAAMMAALAAGSLVPEAQGGLPASAGERPDVAPVSEGIRPDRIPVSRGIRPIDKAAQARVRQEVVGFLELWAAEFKKQDFNWSKAHQVLSAAYAKLSPRARSVVMQLGGMVAYWERNRKAREKNQDPPASGRVISMGIQP